MEKPETGTENQKQIRSPPTNTTLPYYYSTRGVRKNLRDLVPEYEAVIVTEKKVSLQIQTTDFTNIAIAIEKENITELHRILTSTEKTNLIDNITNVTVLHVAAKHSNLELWTILSRSVIFNTLKDSRDIRGTTPLIAAAWYNNLIAVEFLLATHVEVNFTIHDTKKTALHIAADLPTPNICQALLHYNNTPDFIEMVDSDGNTAIMVAMMVNSPCVEVLLENGANYLNKNSLNSRNILHMAVAESNHNMVTYLVMSKPSLDFLNAKDINGFTPLRLAIHHRDMQSIEIFLTSSIGTELLLHIKPSLFHLVKKNLLRIMHLILQYTDKSFYNFYDDEGQTVLLYAVKLGRIQIVQLFLQYKLDVRIKNSMTGESILHAAAYANNDILTSMILNTPGIGDIFNDPENRGFTPFEVILGKSGFRTWSLFIETGYVDYTYLNSNQETTLFMAAKEGNYFMVRCLLLSEPCRRYLESDENLDENDIYNLEMQHNIYTSDIYVMFGVEVQGRVWQKSPSQELLFKHNSKGQNIFHACVLGQSLECLTFVYNYCALFNDQLQDFDAPDMYGNSPLAFATLSGSTIISKFFIVHGADLAQSNKSGQTPLHIIYTNIHEFYEMFSACINECAVTDMSQHKNPKNYMTITYKILCPPGHPQMNILSLLFRQLKDSDTNRDVYIKILKNPVIEYFVLYKWQRLKNTVGLRFFLNLVLVMVFSFYLTCEHCMFLKTHNTMLQIYWFITLLLSLVIVFFSIPVLFMKKLFSFSIIFTAPLLTVVYLVTNTKDRLILELAAVSILLCWFSILIQGYISKMSFQIVMFYQVVRSVFFQLPICILIIFAFSNCFFTLFHNFFTFNNPIHSFIATAVFFVEHGMQFPTLDNSNLHPIIQNNMYNAVDNEKESIIGRKEVWNLAIEGSLLLLFEVIVCICVFGLLIRLAVREGEELELEGKIHRIRIYVQEINSWERFIESSFYKMINKFHLFWLFGTPRRLKEMLKIPVVLHPFSEVPLEEFQIFDLKYIAIDLQSKIPEPLPNLMEMKESQMAQPLRRESMAAQQLKWIYQ